MARYVPARAAITATLVAMAVLLMPGIGPGRASAHAELVASSPGAGDVLTASPDQLVLVFSEPLEPRFSSIDLADAGGRQILSNAGTVSRADAHELDADLPHLADGVYTVSWRSVSAADGHEASGFFSFGVGKVTASIPSAGETHVGGLGDLAVSAFRWLGYLGLLAAIGVSVVFAAVLRRRPTREALRAVSVVLAGSGLVVIGLALFAAATTGNGDIGGYFGSSRVGQLDLSRGAVMLVAGLAAWPLAARRPRAGAWVTLSAGVLASVLLALAGHAAAATDFTAVPVVVVHTWAAAIWMSGLAILLVLVARPRWLPPTEPMRMLVPRFSAVAIASIGLLGMTGFLSSWTQSGSLLDLGNTYGLLLAGKIGLAAVAIGIGAVNYFDGGRGRTQVLGFRSRLGVELSLAIAIVALTSLLSSTAPPVSTQGVSIQPLPDAFGETLPGMGMRVTPGRIGVNRIIVTASGAMSMVPLELVLDRLDGDAQTRITLRPVNGGASMPGMDMPGMDMPGMATDGQAEWAADAIGLPPNSSWNATVRILARAGGTELSRQRFSFALDEDRVVQGIAGGGLDLSLAFAAVFLVGGASAIGLGLGGLRLPRCDPRASVQALLGGGVIALALGILVGGQRLLG